MSASQVRPEDARWETWDRNRLIVLVEKLPGRFGISHHNECCYSVYRVWDTRSVHLTFEDRPGEPHAVYVTKIHDRDRGKKTVEWLPGGLRAWIDALEIGRDDLLEALL